MRSAGRRLLGPAVVPLLLLATGAPSYAESEAGAEARIIFTIDVERIVESSSLAVSTVHRGLVYTTNDSGDGPYVYVLDREGELVGTTTLSGVTPVDIEAISAGKDGTLVVADIGDNSGIRESVTVYRIPQPSAGDHVVTPDAVSLRYADGPRNAESVVYEPAAGRVLVVSKVLLGAKIYRTPRDVFDRGTAVLRPVGDAPMIATDATLLPGRHAIVVRTYGDAVIYHYPGFAYWSDLELPTQEMGESIAWVPGGNRVLAGSEGVDSPVWSVPLPALPHPARAGAGPTAASPTAASPTAASPTRVAAAASTAQAAAGESAPVAAATSSHAPGAQSAIVRLGTSAGVLAAVVAAVVLLSRSRRTRAGR